MPVSNTSVQKTYGISIPQHDYEGFTYPDTTTDVITFRTGGAAGVIVATLTMIYVDSTKERVSSITKT